MGALAKGVPGMTAVLKYDAARQALAEAKAVDEVKDIRDKSEAMRVYARQAKDVDLEIMACDIRLRAERRLGEMLIAAKEAGHLHRGGRPKTSTETEQVSERVTLEGIGIDRKLSSRAQKVGGIAEQAFEAMVGRMRERIAERGSRGALSEIASEDKQQRRAARERVLAGVQMALPNKKYGVIYADPEWRFEVYSRDTGMDRAADNHYPTSATDAICARPVGDIAADDCVLFLWATVPMLPDALKVMAAWGFTYKSHCIWTKDKVGTGYWFRNAHELLLVGTKGNVPAPAMGTQWTSTIEGRVTKHSAKPERFYELIEEYFPSLPKIELNARQTRKGWDAWGNEANVDQDTGEIIETEAARRVDECEGTQPETSIDIQPTTGAVTCGTEAASIEPADVRASVASAAGSPPWRSPLDDGLDLPPFLRRNSNARTDAA